MSVESIAAQECIDEAAAECADAGPALVRTKAEVRAWVAAQRAAGRRVGLVPTMGYLHEGHLSLVDRARALADVVAMSIFVNPLQFGPTEDLERYPRDLERDLELAAGRGTALVFAPSAAEMYPEGEPRVSVVPDEEIGGRLDGGSRPGHFRGVLTVVAKLFGIFTPDVAVFGQKDWQQAALIARMAAELDMPVRVEVAPIVREPDGLAMSSRNVYLSPAERASAGALSRAVKVMPDDEREATREAIMQNVAPYRNEDGSYTAPAATWGVLAR